MEAQERPQFHDSSLRQALDTVGPEIESFTERLDKLSGDIKQLEGYLDRSGIRVKVDVPMDPRSYESVTWEKGEPDRWRVMYLMDPPESGNWDHQRAHCPLIEAPVEVRLRARKVLPRLLRAVAEAAVTDDATTIDADGAPPSSDDDIPF